jgi:murein tripeptide amidase MpaA
MKIKRKLSIILLICLLTMTSFVSSIVITIEDEQVIITTNASDSSRFKIMRIPYLQQSDLDPLITQGIHIIEIRDKDVIASASDSELNILTELGYQPILLDDSTYLSDEKDEQPLETFHTYSTLTIALQQIATTYPNIAMIYDLGHSVQGRTLWGLKITDNPGVEENEPEVRIAGNHHGNEYMSVELPLLLAYHLVQNYTVDAEITDLINNREIWIIPMVNPDGREAGSRYNANGVDLNRDYGYMWGGDSPSPFSQPETQVMRNHALDNNFVFSLSFHTSAAVVNYVNLNMPRIILLLNNFLLNMVLIMVTGL